MMPLLASVVLLVPYTDNLSTDFYGELAIYISFTLLLQIFFNYGIDNYLGIHHFDYKDDPQKMKNFMGTIVSFLLIIGGILILIFLLAGASLFQLTLSQKFSFYPYGFMSVITAFCNSFFRTYVNFLFYKDKPIRYFLLNLFNFLITVLICWGGLVLYPQSLIGPMWGRLLSGIAIFLVAFILFIRQYGITWKPEMLMGIHKFCIPVVIFFVLSWISLYFNNYIINAFSNTADVGVYDFALKCTMLIEFVQNGILGTVNARIYALWKVKNQTVSSVEENRYHHVFSMFTVLFIAGNIVALPYIIRMFVSNESYYAVFEFIPVLCASFVFRGMYNAYYNVVLYQKKTTSLPRALAITSAIQIIVCLLLIQKFGIWGAVWSYVLSKPVQAFFLWLESRKLFSFQYNFMKVFGLPLMYFLFVICLQFLPIQISAQYSAIIQFLFAVIFILIVFRKDFKDVKYVIRK